MWEDRMAEANNRDTNPDYWDEYTNLQHVKHSIIRSYLNGWIPKLGFTAGRIVYMDTHAGRGRHHHGELGSPLIALKTFLEHSSRNRILERCEVVFYLIEQDSEYLGYLHESLASFGKLPKNLCVEPVSGDCYDVIGNILASYKATGDRLAPAFIFVDPYGFKIPGRLLKALLEFPHVELLVNLMWRELDMALCRGRNEAWGTTMLDGIFDGDSWRGIDSTDIDERANQAIEALQNQFKAKWTTSIRMLGDNRETRYALVHYSNHPAGRDLMKDCLWRICPDGDFYVRKNEDYRQQLLLSPEPNLDELEQLVLESLGERPCKWSDLTARIRPLIWRSTHLNAVIRKLRGEGRIVGSHHQGKFAQSNDPLLSLA